MMKVLIRHVQVKLMTFWQSTKARFLTVRGSVRCSQSPQLTSMTTPISSMRKAEIVEELTTLGAEFNPKDNMSLLSELLKATRLARGIPSKRQEAEKDGTKGLTGLNKLELMQKAEGLGISIIPSATRAWLITKITTVITDNQVPKGTDTMPFGKHEGVQYDTILKIDPTYATVWARQCIQDGTAHPQLKRLVRYADMQETGKTGGPMLVHIGTPEPSWSAAASSSRPVNPKPKARGPPKRMAAPSDPDHAIKMPVDASNNPQDEAVNLLRGLAQRMENMEQEIQRQKAETAARDQIEQMSQSSGQSSLAHWVKPKSADAGL